MVEVRSKAGEVVELDQETYDLYQGLMQLAKRTSSKIIRAAAARLAADLEPSKESRFLHQFIDQYLAFSHSIEAIA